MILKVCDVCLAGIFCYLFLGTIIALIVALSWNKQRGPYDAGPYVLLWPLTLILAFADAVKDLFGSLCQRLNSLAMRDKTVRPKKKSLMQRVRI